MFRKTLNCELNRLSPSDYQAATKQNAVLVLDNIRSQHNIGAVFRTADAFCLQGVWLCGICCCPPNSEIHKTALGAELTVDWRYFEHTLDAVRTLQADGYTVYAIEQAHGSTILSDLQLPQNQKTAIVMGHEVFGVQQEVVDAADGCIEIPQYGTKHSLNVSVTAGIVMYQLSNMLR
jgi:tRNA G18 (ribose-2'-O)-methylase SpoU